MKAAVLHAIGETPHCEAFPDPRANDGEVLVRVCAASLKPVDRQIASGSHYASPREFPVVCGIDGVGILQDGARVFFAGPRRPYGAMAELAVVRRSQCLPVPEGLSDDVAAAVPNPGVSAWLSLNWRARLVRGETVLVLGATGVTGQLAVQIAKLLGAQRVIAAGRNKQVLDGLGSRGADAVISLDDSETNVTAAFAREASTSGFQVIIDYLWGRPTEALLAAITRREFASITSEIRLVQAGESAGPTITLPAAVLRSTAVSILGTAGIPEPTMMRDAFDNVMTHAVNGKLRIDTQRVPLSEIETAWNYAGRSRLLVVP